MILLRSIGFNLAFYLWTTIMVLAYVPGLWMSHRVTVSGQRRWAGHVVWLMRVLAGIEIDIRGAERRPPGGHLIAAKHQSARDTLIWHLIVDDPAVVMKRELLAIPIYGAYCRKSRMIPVDRQGGPTALRAMIEAGRAAIREGRPIIIFPQGTRAAPDLGTDIVPYQPGIAALYRGLDVAVVPVALNSGLYWPRRSFFRYPGRIVLEYLAPIAPGLDRRAFMAALEDAIETATVRLVAEGRGQLGG